MKQTSEVELREANDVLTDAVNSALTGPIRATQVVAWYSDGSEAVVAYRRAEPTFQDRPYVTHVLTDEGAFSGNYDLTLEEALQDAAEWATARRWGA